jgi:hypothetical protein
MSQIFREIVMRATALGGFVLVILLGSPLAAETGNDRRPQPTALVLPATTDDCLQVMEVVLERTLAADLLDEQIEQAEVELARMEDNCLDQRFAEAVEAAREVERIVASNK